MVVVCSAADAVADVTQVATPVAILAATPVAVAADCFPEWVVSTYSIVVVAADVIPVVPLL